MTLWPRIISLGQQVEVLAAAQEQRAVSIESRGVNFHGLPTLSTHAHAANCRSPACVVIGVRCVCWCALLVRASLMVGLGFKLGAWVLLCSLLVCMSENQS